MTLVDTSVWVGFFRSGNAALERLLNQDGVMTHPWVIGELALGGLIDANLDLLNQLPKAQVATDLEVLSAIENCNLRQAGVGYVDAQLLVSTMLTSGAKLWTNDASLSEVAGRLGVNQN